MNKQSKFAKHVREVDKVDLQTGFQQAGDNTLKSNVLEELPKNWLMFYYSNRLGNLINDRPSINEFTFMLKMLKLQQSFHEYYQELNTYIDAMVFFHFL